MSDVAFLLLPSRDAREILTPGQLVDLEERWRRVADEPSSHCRPVTVSCRLCKPAVSAPSRECGTAAGSDHISQWPSASGARCCAGCWLRIDTALDHIAFQPLLAEPVSLLAFSWRGRQRVFTYGVEARVDIHGPLQSSGMGTSWWRVVNCRTSNVSAVQQQ